MRPYLSESNELKSQVEDPEVQAVAPDHDAWCPIGKKPKNGSNRTSLITENKKIHLICIDMYSFFFSFIPMIAVPHVWHDA